MYNNLLINGLSSMGQEAFSELSMYALGILGIVAFAALVVGLFNDRANSIICIILGIAAMFFIHKLSDPMTSKEEWQTVEDVNAGFVIAWTAIFFCIMLLRFLPCIRTETEKSTYLILGTLIEATESKTVGCITAIGVPTICSIGYYFLSDWLVNNSWYYIGYIAFGIFLLLSVVGFIRSFFYW